MAWQDLFPLPGARIDAEEERELRLVAQARGGADWALSALVARYQPTVSRYLSRLTGSIELSSVLAERIFRHMDQRIRGPQGGKQLRLWLLRTSTEMGLDALREPHSRGMRALTGPRGPAGLLPGKAVTGPLRTRLGGLGEMTSKTSRQVLKMIWSAPDERVAGSGSARTSQNGHAAGHDADASDDPFPDLDPREALRFKMIRAVLAELPYGDAQCLALHLIAGLNQAEVARALGITGSAARKRVVHGLQLFAMRYEAAAASLRLPPETAQERQSRIFESPTVAPELTEQPARLSNGAAPRAGATIPPSPPLNTEPPRIVSADPEEPVEDEVAAAMAGDIHPYDLADEATVVIDPIVVEADSRLPVPASAIAGASGNPAADLWFARELAAIPEPHLTVGSIPLADMALTLEVVDEPMNLPPVVAHPEVVEAPGEPEPAISSAVERDLATHPTEDAAEDVARDEGDELVLVDLDALTRTPLSSEPVIAAEDDTLVETDTRAVDDAFLNEADPVTFDNMISIVDARDAEVVAVSGSGVREDSRVTADTTPGAPAETNLPGAGPDGERATPSPAAPGVASEAAEMAAPLARGPRRVPVLSTAQAVESSETRPAPRRVPVLTGDPAAKVASEHEATVTKQAQVERVSHR